MMSTYEFIAKLNQQDIKLWLDGERLRINAPEGALTPALIAQLRERKPAIMAFLREHQEGSTVTTIQRLDESKRMGPLPLSFAQQRLWFLAQLEGSSDAYNMPAALHLRGPLDVAALSASCRTLCERHETLRTTFLVVNEEAHQQINPASFELELIDLSDASAEQQEADVTRLSRQESAYPFDLMNGPLWRVTLLRLAREEHVLLLTMHHIISDGWSMGVLIRELSALYAALSGNTSKGPDSLPALSIQYADFAVWQREWLSGAVLQQQLEYWQTQLADVPPLLTLPTDYPRPAVQSYRGDHLEVTLSKSLIDELTSWSQKNNATLFMALQAAFAVLLSRYSGQEDICIGTPIANRQITEVENLIGFFVNTLVLRNDLSAPSGHPLTFHDFLARVRQVALDAYEHQALPFELLVETLQPERSLSYAPLFQVMFTLHNNRQEALPFSEITATLIEVEYPVAKFDLSLDIREREEDFTASWEYNTDLFDRATIERMAEHFQILLTGIVANPLTPITHLPLLSEAETHQLLVEWNDTSVPCPSDTCFHELFEAQAARTPDAPALLYQPPAQTDAPAVRLTYRELNERANQLAHHLRALGVGGSLGTEAVVGVCMERCAEMVISLLAIFKAGGVYIPLDPALPQKRLSYMLTNSEAKVVLTKSQYTNRLQEGDHQAQLVYLDSDSVPFGYKSLIAEQPLHNPLNLSTPQNLAYVIYTSGSTGLPKGAMVEQQGMVNHLYTKVIDLNLTSGDRIAETAPASFDISIWQFLSALLVGGAVHIFDNDTVRNPAQLLARTEAEKITILEVVPSLFRFMLDELATLGDDKPEFSDLRWVLLTGEALPPPLCREWLAYYPHIPLMNAYGPTECADDVTHHVISEPPAPDAVTVPIGRTVPNMRLYILDRYMQPVPIGVPGELYVGGIGVGRGYLNDPERTAKAFMDDPFVPAPPLNPPQYFVPQHMPWGGSTGRFYKTGDLVRYRPDSTMEFLGRIDNQVKIRGFRIELGEIEALLTEHESVREAIVIVYDKKPSGKRLLAYVVGEGITISTLRSYLGQKLPDYMIPSVFVPLEAMPLTPNGKINRRALAERSLDAEDSELSFMAPRNQIEQQLVHIWQEVLGLHSVGRRDSFFDLGGHSLLAVRLMARIQQHFGINLPLATLFQFQTIEQLATRLASKAVDWSVLVPIQPKGDNLPFFCVPGAGGNIIYLYDFARSMGAEQPFYGLQAVGLDGETAPYTTIEAIAAHNINAIQKVQPQGPYLLAGHSFGGPVAFEMAQQLLKAGHEIARLIIIDTSAPAPGPEPDYFNWDDTRWVVATAEVASEWVGQKTSLSYEELLPLDPEEQLIRFKEELERLDMLPVGSELNQARAWAQIYKTNNLTNYLPKHVIPTPITLLRAEEEQAGDPETDKEEKDRTWGWQQFAKGQVDVISVPGNHITMMRQPHIEVLAERLREYLLMHEARG